MVELQKPMLDDAVKEINTRLGGIVLGIYLVGGRTKRLSSDVDLAVVCSKPYEKFTDDEYYNLIFAEDSLTHRHKINFELFVRTRKEFEALGG